MDLSQYSLEDMILAALRSEIDSRDLYKGIAERVKNAFLKERLLFLSSEEEKHREFVQSLYERQFSDKELSVPKVSPVPLPEIRFEQEIVPISAILSQAMNAEKAAHDFYLGLSKRYEEDETIRKTLVYFSKMEMGHYNLLQAERENVLQFEDFDVELPMAHMGP
jgi:rubrerythrin